jgi:hypothetical protein
MTTAVLNSVPSDKSGIASAINGSLREIGTAFGVALLGTLANRAYQNFYANSPEIQSVKGAAPADVAATINLVGSGMNYGGDVIQQLGGNLGLPPDTIATMQQVSADAFMRGMDRAVIFSGIGILIAGVLSFLLIDDEVVAKPIEDRLPEQLDNEIAIGIAD